MRLSRVNEDGCCVRCGLFLCEWSLRLGSQHKIFWHRVVEQATQAPGELR